MTGQLRKKLALPLYAINSVVVGRGPRGLAVLASSPLRDRAQAGAAPRLPRCRGAGACPRHGAVLVHETATGVQRCASTVESRAAVYNHAHHHTAHSDRRVIAACPTE